MWPFLGSLVSAGASILGGSMMQDAQAEQNAIAREMADEQFDFQKTLAKEGIRMRVRDARAAGIHPLYALGASPMSFSPVTAGLVPETGMAAGLANAGQDIGRAINATRTSGERDEAFSRAIQSLQLTRGGLENELLASQIARLRQQMNPPLPGVVPNSTTPFPVPESGKVGEREPLMLFGKRVLTDPDTSPMRAWENQIGDDGPISWLAQLAVATSMMKENWHRFGSAFGMTPQNNADWYRALLGRTQ